MIVVDSHIHVRRVFDLTRFFDTAEPTSTRPPRAPGIPAPSPAFSC
jgi:hypothetical protein